MSQLNSNFSRWMYVCVCASWLLSWYDKFIYVCSEFDIKSFGYGFCSCAFMYMCYTCCICINVFTCTWKRCRQSLPAVCQLVFHLKRGRVREPGIWEKNERTYIHITHIASYICECVKAFCQTFRTPNFVLIHLSYYLLNLNIFFSIEFSSFHFYDECEYMCLRVDFLCGRLDDIATLWVICTISRLTFGRI